MGIAKGSNRIVWSFGTITLISIVIAIPIWYSRSIFWHFSVPVALAIWWIFITWTFRDPKREITKNPDNILAPADGTIIELIETEEGISCTIRMSPFDVHMTRCPINGKVDYVKFKKGSHWPAYFPNYAVRNQRNAIRIIGERFNEKAIVTQVSGIFARRTIAYVEKGNKVLQGEVIGTIRFGSITTLQFISAKRYKIVQPPPKITRAGITILATQEKDSD